MYLVRSTVLIAQVSASYKLIRVMFNNKLYNCWLIYSFICNSAFTGEANLCDGDKVNLNKTFYELN